jgi:hypothetical protein
MRIAKRFTSGQLGKFVHRSRETIRRYEALGLIPAGQRDPINRRRYWSAAQAKQIRELLKPVDAIAREAPCERGNGANAGGKG